jgi:hypothetical protein
VSQLGAMSSNLALEANGEPRRFEVCEGNLPCAWYLLHRGFDGLSEQTPSSVSRNETLGAHSPGPTLPTCAAQQVGSYLRYTDMLPT